MFVDRDVIVKTFVVGCVENTCVLALLIDNPVDLIALHLALFVIVKIQDAYNCFSATHNYKSLKLVSVLM